MKEVRELGNTPKDLGPNEETGISKAAAKFVKANMSPADLAAVKERSRKHKAAHSNGG